MSGYRYLDAYVIICVICMYMCACDTVHASAYTHVQLHMFWLCDALCRLESIVPLMQLGLWKQGIHMST